MTTQRRRDAEQAEFEKLGVYCSFGYEPLASATGGDSLDAQRQTSEPSGELATGHGVYGS